MPAEQPDQTNDAEEAVMADDGYGDEMGGVEDAAEAMQYYE